MHLPIGNFLPAVLIILSNIPLSAQEPSAPANLTVQQRNELLAEGKRLWNAARKFDEQGNLEAAIQSGSQLLETARLIGDAHQEVLFLIDWLAERHERHQDFAAAQLLRKEALPLAISLFKEQPWKVTDARVALHSVQRLAALDPGQQEQLRDSEQLNSRVISLYGKGEYAAATRLAEQALRLRQSVLGDKAPGTAICLNDVAVLHEAMGNYAKAEPLLEQALQIRKEVLGEKHPDTAHSTGNLGALYHSMGDHAKAQPLLEQALQIRKEVLGEKHPDTANSFNHLALLYQSMGDYAKAEPLLEQALQIRKRVLGEEHPDTASALNNLGGLYKSMGDYTKAEPLYRRALQIKESVLGEEHPSTAASHNNLAELYRSMGDYSKAEPLFEQALQIRKMVLGEEHPHTAQSLNNLAALYKSLGDYEKAEPLYRQALQTRKKVLGKQHPETATSLSNLAELYKSMGDFAQAEPLYEQALRIQKTVMGEDHPDTATSLSNLAGLYDSMHDHANAEPLYVQALQVRKTVLGEQHLSTATTLNNLAFLYLSMGDYSKAEPLFRQALAVFRNQLELTAVVQSQREQLAMTSSLRLSLDNYLSFAASTGRSQQSAYEQLLAWKGSVLLRQRAIRAVADQPELQDDFKQLASVTKELARLSFQIPSAGQQKSWQDRIAKLSAQKESLEGTLVRNSGGFREALEPVKLDAVRRALPDDGVLIDFIEYGHHDGGQRVAAFVLSKHRPLRMLDLADADSVNRASDHWRKAFDDHARHAWRANANAERASQWLRNSIWRPIEAAIGDAKVVLISPDGAVGKLPFAALSGKEQGTYLIEERAFAIILAAQDLPRLLAGRSEKWAESNLLVLGGVNYNAADPISSHSDSTSKRNNSIATQYATFARAPRSADQATFSSLPGTKDEAAGIEQLYRRMNFDPRFMTVLEGAAANEATVRLAAPNHSYLHLATHGFFASPRIRSALDRTARDHERLSSQFVSEQRISGYHPGLLSGIGLAGANKPDPEGDDGILTAEEVSTLDLTRVQLCVMSACETGLGKTAGGEGLLGLQRALQVAGARTVIASLWKVDDLATRQLMVRFYENHWQKRMGKLAALREAQLWMLNKHRRTIQQPRLGDRGQRDAELDDGPVGNRNRPSPYYWAAFVLSGDWR